MVTVQAIANAVRYSHLSTDFDSEYGIVWSWMNPKGRPCFSMDLLKELRHHEAQIERSHGQIVHDEALHKVNYVVFGSRVPGVFNLGGDLDLFGRLYRERDREGLLEYAKLCIDDLYPRVVNYDLPLTTIALVQGKALGGGFECALGANVLIAERSAEMGLPEVLFNLFPGMGAWSFLSRKVGPKLANEMIMSGRIYSASELHQFGVVDMIAEDGAGESAVYQYIDSMRAKRNSLLAMQQVRQISNPVSYEELLKITTLWVDSVFNLTPRDLKMMDRLVRAQHRLADGTKERAAAERVADAR